MKKLLIVTSILIFALCITCFGYSSASFRGLSKINLKKQIVKRASITFVGIQINHDGHNIFSRVNVPVTLTDSPASFKVNGSGNVDYARGEHSGSYEHSGTDNIKSLVVYGKMRLDTKHKASKDTLKVEFSQVDSEVSGNFYEAYYGNNGESKNSFSFNGKIDTLINNDGGELMCPISFDGPAELLPYADRLIRHGWNYSKFIYQGTYVYENGKTINSNNAFSVELYATLNSVTYEDGTTDTFGETAKAPVVAKATNDEKDSGTVSNSSPKAEESSEVKDTGNASSNVAIAEEGAEDHADEKDSAWVTVMGTLGAIMSGTGAWIAIGTSAVTDFANQNTGSGTLPENTASTPGILPKKKEEEGEAEGDYSSDDDVEIKRIPLEFETPTNFYFPDSTGVNDFFNTWGAANSGASEISKWVYSFTTEGWANSLNNFATASPTNKAFYKNELGKIAKEMGEGRKIVGKLDTVGKGLSYIGMTLDAVKNCSDTEAENGEVIKGDNVVMGVTKSVLSNMLADSITSSEKLGGTAIVAVDVAVNLAFTGTKAADIMSPVGNIKNAVNFGIDGVKYGIFGGEDEFDKRALNGVYGENIKNVVTFYGAATEVIKGNTELAEAMNEDVTNDYFYEGMHNEVENLFASDYKHVQTLSAPVKTSLHFCVDVADYTAKKAQDLGEITEKVVSGFDNTVDRCLKRLKFWE